MTREEAIKQLHGMLVGADWLSDYMILALSVAIEALKQPERKTGEWIDCETSPHYKCNQCGERAPMYWGGEISGYAEWWSDFCPNCGTRMVKDETD